MKSANSNESDSPSHKTLIIFLILISLFAFIIRLVGLNRVPPGISSDVLLYFVNARAIAETGKDIYGQVYPLFSSHKGFLVSPVFMYVVAFFYKIFGFSFTLGYIPNVIASVLSIVMASLLAVKLTGKRLIGLFTGIILSISPWHYHLSRTGFEGVFAFCLVLIGIYFSVLALKQWRYYIATFVLFGLASFSYKGVNIFLVLYPLLYVLTIGWKKIKRIHIVLFTISIWLFVVCQWFFLFVRYHDTYSTGFINNNFQTAQKNADSERVLSDAPHIIRIFMSNAPISISRMYFSNYLHFFSPQYLLTSGDVDFRYSTGGGGQLYFWDILFIVAGIIWLLKARKKSELLFLTAIIIVSPLAALISDQQYAIRTFISVFALSILISSGLYYFFEQRKSFKFKIPLLITVVFLYGISAILYLYRYHYLYVHYGRESWDGVNEEVFTEAYQLQSHYRQIAFGRSSEFDYIAFVYWNKLPIEEIQRSLQVYDEKTLSYKNIQFVRTCSFRDDDIEQNSIMQDELLFTKEPCIKDIEPLKKYYLPKTLIWKWKTYDWVTVDKYFKKIGT